MQQTNTLIIGASISGLASAACLRRQKVEYIIIEKHDRVATPWRDHYERLHLHTNKGFSHLPFKKFGKSIPRYPSKQEVIDYLEDYQKEFKISPVFNTEAKEVYREGDEWITITSNGEFRSKYLVMATGAFGRSRPLQFKGMETFPGPVLHSCNYRTGKDFKGQNVLVVGFGNSACEIAIDLYEQGARPSMAVRSPVNVIPRDVLGIPVLVLSWLMNRLSPRLADAISSPLLNILIGDLSRLGLKKMPYGPLEQIRRDGKAPVLDIGTIKHIRQGHLGIYADIDRIEGEAIYFIDGRKSAFDAIIAAIGYDRDTEIVDKYLGDDGLYFCGYWISPTGQIREIGRDAQKIAGDIARKGKSVQVSACTSI